MSFCHRSENLTLRRRNPDQFISSGIQGAVAPRVTETFCNHPLSCETGFLRTGKALSRHLIAVSENECLPGEKKECCWKGEASGVWMLTAALPGSGSPSTMAGGD